MADYVWEKRAGKVIAISPDEEYHNYIAVVTERPYIGLRISVFESPQSTLVRQNYKMSDLFSDLNNPTEKEMNMFELSLGINIRGYFELMRNDDES